ncbi:MAG: hypothetical protein N3G80_04615 [Candidatus Micrarchaeota archaeon]|nr:hypothetical protein [Candidatus Micrarchaeota archaeon]
MRIRFQKVTMQHRKDASFQERMIENLGLYEKAKLSERWEYCRGLFHSPIINEPMFGAPPKGYRGAHHDLSSGKTWIDIEYVEKIAKESKIDKEHILCGLMIRQIAAYMKFPRTVTNAIIVEKMMRDFFGSSENEETIRYAVNSFCALCADAACIAEKEKAKYILALRDAVLEAEPENKVNLIAAYYLKTRIGLEAERVPKEIEDVVEKLHTVNIDALGKDIEETRRAVLIWVKIIKKLKEQGGFSFFGLLRGKKYGGWLLSSYEPHDVDQFPSLKNADKRAVKKAISEAAKSLSLAEFEGLLEMMKGQLPGLKEEEKEIAAGFLAFDKDIEASPSTVRYYLTLLDNYCVAVEKMPIESEGWRKAVKGTERFKVDSPIYKAMPFTSGGKILPGITRMIGEGKRKRKTTNYEIPDALIVIDSSDSMPHPAKAKSPIVATAMAVAKAYFSLGAKVGVINFGPKTYYLDYQKAQENVFLAIVAKQHGGTKIDVETLQRAIEKDEKAGKMAANRFPFGGNAELEETLEQTVQKTYQLPSETIERMANKQKVDVFLFSDMKIANLEETIQLLSKKSNVNRITIVSNREFDWKKEGLAEKIRIYENVKSIDVGVQIAVRQAKENAGY